MDTDFWPQKSAKNAKDFFAIVNRFPFGHYFAPQNYRLLRWRVFFRGESLLS